MQPLTAQGPRGDIFPWYVWCSLHSTALLLLKEKGLWLWLPACHSLVVDHRYVEIPSFRPPLPTLRYRQGSNWSILHVTIMLPPLGPTTAGPWSLRDLPLFARMMKTSWAYSKLSYPGNKHTQKINQHNLIAQNCCSCSFQVSCGSLSPGRLTCGVDGTSTSVRHYSLMHTKASRVHQSLKNTAKPYSYGKY